MDDPHEVVHGAGEVRADQAQAHHVHVHEEPGRRERNIVGKKLHFTFIHWVNDYF